MTSPKNQANHNQDSAPHANPRLLKSLGCLGTVGLLGSTSLLSNVALAQGTHEDTWSLGDIAALTNESNADLAGLGVGMFAETLNPTDVADASVSIASASGVTVPETEPLPVEAAPEAYAAPEPYEAPPAVEESYVAPEPAYAPPADSYATDSYAEDSYVEATPAPVEEVYVAPEPVLPAPQLDAPVVNLTPADLAPPTSDSFDGFNAGGSQAVIDSSDLYSTGATGGQEQLLEPPAVVVTERNSDAVVATPTVSPDADVADSTEQPVIAGDGPATPQAAPVAASGDSVGNGIVGDGSVSDVSAQADESPTVLFNPPRNASLPNPQAAPTTQVAGNSSANNGYSITYPTQLPNPLQTVVQSLGRSLTQSVDAASYYARTQRPSALPGNGDRRLLFPLSVPSPISSVFGWRVHPIHQVWKFHSGTDFAAEQGTPIVAALSGRISTADFVGGYGLTVVVDHVGGQSQTLYGHMSELFVRPGQTVRQGEVIGRVGSTGYSTGPHLHFEVRKRDENGGWVAIAPEQHLEGSVAQLMKVLRGQPLQLGQLSPIPLAQNPFKIKPSQTTGLSTGLTQLLQQPNQPTAGQWPNSLAEATPLERAVVQVVKSLETQPYATAPSRSAPQPLAPRPANSAEALSYQLQAPQPAPKLAQAELQHDNNHNPSN